MFTTKVVAFKGLIIAMTFKSDEMGLFTFENQNCFLCLGHKKRSTKFVDLLGNQFFNIIFLRRNTLS